MDGQTDDILWHHRGVAIVRRSHKICELNAYSFVRAKATDFKFGVLALMDNPDMATEKILEKGVTRVT